jgi:hypothetical protein
MNLARRIALAAVLAVAAAAPAVADEWWTYRGGPKGPPSLTSPDYVGSYGLYGAYGGPAFGYAGPYDGYGYRW